MFDMNDAEPQKSGELIPDGTFAKVVMTIRPGGIDGQSEINELHVPLGRPVKVTFTSEDVLHALYIPAFRVKADAIPGRYSSIWFTPTKTGQYHLFCAEYCGTKHSGMIGSVYVMEPNEYQAWLSGSGEGSLAQSGQKLFEDLACTNCHKTDNTGRCPNPSSCSHARTPTARAARHSHDTRWSTPCPGRNR